VSFDTFLQARREAEEDVRREPPDWTQLADLLAGAKRVRWPHDKVRQLEALLGQAWAGGRKQGPAMVGDRGPRWLALLRLVGLLARQGFALEQMEYAREAVGVAWAKGAAAGRPS
jgi:hypothetical protein